jgi:hypothetical protein
MAVYSSDSALWRYEELVRALAVDGQDLPAAVELVELCQTLGIDPAWALDEVRRLRRGWQPNSLRWPA